METGQPSTRAQIIQAALRCYRRRAIGGTTLRDVAQEAGLRLGNLYYHVKTREELVLAVLDECERELRALLGRLAPLEPRTWLAGYFAWLLEDPAGAADAGCPFGTLAAELRALGDPAAPRAAGIVLAYQDAVATQASAAGIRSSIFLEIQGAYTVARVLGDPELFRRSVEELRDSTLGAEA
ncbi:TetR/AcrR family transcriptional regulator [Deinococcus koreensis]|uniref:TetR/AcrR family transcriptional regulator n=1 Tax=Deinococcus koreensis TaxID=2054903 RepID=A0A2K3US57_9DEIO|nr:TetR/AcrR family transcriptional regulator [Deinococcus koreensis]PNY79379.1 TetR/AcrR family transcriptional regulator [Deinococcus koreensis]